MSVIGRVESLWRYPVKSMRGEAVGEAFIGFAGVYGDRLFAVRSAASPKGFPYLTGREHREMLLYRPRFRHPDKAARPPNLAEAEGMAPGLSPVYAGPDDLAVDVETPWGEVLAIDDPALVGRLNERVGRGHALSLTRSDRSMTDCRPLSLFSVQTAGRLGRELGRPVDKRRFRANLYLDLDDGDGFAEDGLVGGTLRLGARVTVAVLERDPRCAMITLDPDTAERDPAVLKAVSRRHGGMAGVYAAVLVEGTVRPGDAVERLS
jgi:uncharacterized protein YcbX